MMAFPNDLLRFVSTVPLLNDGTIPLNTIDSTNSFVSTLYDATPAVSVIARTVKKEIEDGNITATTEGLESNTVVYKALNSDLATYAPNIYTLLRSVALEAFSLLYTIDNSPRDLQYVSSADISRARNNLNYVTDYMSTEEKYYNLIEDLRTMNISFGYIENQIDVIMKDRSGRS
jgi:hypothetical protein